MNKFKLYCNVDGWVEVIASSLPTVCPIDNAHSITTESIVLIEENIQVNDGTATELTLDNYKALRYHEIDARTEELILNGFSYASKVFSLSQNAQINILALHETRNDPALIYPIEYSTLNDSDNYFVIDADDLHSMYLTALATKKAHVDSGTLIKDSIRAAVDEAAVDAIIDNR
jgi:hypothetical protein